MNIVVTGSSTGIGRALTDRLLASGHHVWGIARSNQSDQVSLRIDGHFRASSCDIADWGQVARVADEVASAWSHLDALITCAAVHGEIGRALAASPADWSATIRTNLDGTFHTLRAFDSLLSRVPRRAKIICFSGGGAAKARPRFSAYGVAKTGVVRLVETIAAEERGRALDINAIAPGLIRTRLTDEIVRLGPVIVGEAEFAAAQRAGPPVFDRVLDLVEWLLSEASDGISGRLLSAEWDPWPLLGEGASQSNSDVYTLRRIVPDNPNRAPAD